MAEKILVIEDNENNRLLLKSILSCHGYEVLEAEDGQAGIDMAIEHKPSLILMDIQMPVMDGICALKIMKNNQELKRTPVVALTSFAMKGDREKLLGEGFDAFVSKPIDTREVPELVKRLLHKRGL